MKTNFILILLNAILITSSFARNSMKDAQNFSSTSYTNLPTSISSDCNSKYFGGRSLAPIENISVVNPEAILNLKYEQDITLLIAQNNKITEYVFPSSEPTFYGELGVEEMIRADQQITESMLIEEVRPLFLEPTIEDRIAEDQAITESNGSLVD
jgi:hypothetical protein